MLINRHNTITFVVHYRKEFFFFEMPNVPTRRRHYPRIWIKKKITRTGYFIKIFFPVSIESAFMYDNLRFSHSEKFCI